MGICNKSMNIKYCNSLTKYSRYKTRVVNIGNVSLGGDNPIRVQSMTTTDTMDTIATVEQSIRIIEAGADYVRITAPSLKEAQNLKNIKDELRKRGYTTPLIADIHFTPNAAEIAAAIVEKVRVNPGNYADRKRFKIFEITDQMYAEELERIHESFSPLVKVCKEHGTAMRIGTNHGSLSDRIMNRYGDTPMGMVESALEFVRICESLDYHDIVLSMKASNVQIMVEAYRLLVSKMEEEGMNYPLHLGVTEAGGGEDGRIKSAAGIGTLLEDGIGDTIRVSLTEEPEEEVPVALHLVKRYNDREEHLPIPEITENPINPFERTRRESIEVDMMGNKHVPVVMLTAGDYIERHFQITGTSTRISQDLYKWDIKGTNPDFIYLGIDEYDYSFPIGIKKIYDYEFWCTLKSNTNSYPLYTANNYLSAEYKSDGINFLALELGELNDEIIKAIKDDKRCVIVVKTSNQHGIAEQRRFFIELINRGIKAPVIINRKYEFPIHEDKVILYCSTDFGGLLIDGLGDGIWLEAPELSLDNRNNISFGILQATRTRISKTEYIACPSCGRTQFDLQQTTEKIQNRTGHLIGIKIAVMGCIVNGPGEMADADFGYVGSGPGKISLYRGKEGLRRRFARPMKLCEPHSRNKGRMKPLPRSNTRNYYARRWRQR